MERVDEALPPGVGAAECRFGFGSQDQVESDRLQDCCRVDGYRDAVFFAGCDGEGAVHVVEEGVVFVAAGEMCQVHCLACKFDLHRGVEVVGGVEHEGYSQRPVGVDGIARRAEVPAGLLPALGGG